MSATGLVLRLLTVGVVVLAVNIAHGQGRLRGYEERVAEEKASREYVFDKMKAMHFCRWLEITRFDEDCRSERARQTKDNGNG